MHKLTSPAWWAAAATRAIKTAAQTAIGLFGTSLLITDVPWEVVTSGAGLATILSLLTSLAGLPEVPDDNTP